MSSVGEAKITVTPDALRDSSACLFGRLLHPAPEPVPGEISDKRCNTDNERNRRESRPDGQITTETGLLQLRHGRVVLPRSGHESGYGRAERVRGEVPA
jgi:hypothetical protein